MIRVLHIIDHLGPGGAQTALLNLLLHADRTRFEHTIASLHGDGEVAEEFRRQGFTVVSLSPSKWPPRYVGNLRRLLKKESFAIVHCHLFGANWIAKPIAWLSGQRVIFNHDQCNDAMRENWLYRTVDRVTNFLSTRILAVSRSTVDFLVQREGVSEDRVEYFPNGVALSILPTPTAESRAAARERWQLPADRLIVGGIGRLVPQKDFFTFIRAAAFAAAQRPDLHFVIFGAGPDEEKLRERVRKLGLSSRVTFAGYVTDRAAIYSAIDVLFLTSLFEGTPMVLLEAMAAGIPIAASAVDGTAEVLRSGHDALLFPPGDPAAASGALLQLASDPAKREMLVESALRKVRSSYDTESLMQRLESLYEAAL